MMEIRYDADVEIEEVDLLGEAAFAQKHGKWYGYWAEMPEPGERADEIRCEGCGEEPDSCQCDETTN